MFRRIRAIFCFSTIWLALFAGLSISCSQDKLPVTEIEKIRFAFDGVEKSFSMVGKQSIAPEKHQSLRSKAIEQGLNAISQVLEQGHDESNSLDGLEYDQPPMIQFQYLKALFEKAGNSFVPGQKYHHAMTGKVYLDIANGERKSSEDGAGFEYDYVFDLAFALDIDDNDMINADVVMDMTVSKGEPQQAGYQSRKGKVFVSMTLDYDMKSFSPDYELTMRVSGDESEFEYLGNPFDYEYDYVKVTDGSIAEWRKFGYTVSGELIRDAGRSSFDDNAGVELVEDHGLTLKWYHDSKLHYIPSPTAAQVSGLRNAYFSHFGLNSTDMGHADFDGRQSMDDELVLNFYNDMTKIRGGREIIYDFITHNDSGSGDDSDDSKSVGIRIMTSNHSGGFENFAIGKNVSISDLFADGSAWTDTVNQAPPTIWHVDEKGKPVSQVTDFSVVSFCIRAAGGSGDGAAVPADAMIEKALSDNGLLVAGADSSFDLSVTVGSYTAWTSLRYSPKN